MNEDPTAPGWRLSWQGQVTGPHSLREIQSLLRTGRIHSLYKVQVDGEWLLLRDHLADLIHREPAAERVVAPQPRSGPANPVPSVGVPKAIPIPDAPPWRSAEDTIALRRPTADGGDPVAEPKGMAIAAFALAALFFVPYLNGITWLLALISGHLAAAQTEADRRGPVATLAWVGLWLCYVEISFFLLALAWFLVRDIPTTNLVYLMLHGRMLFSGLAALLGAGVLMLVLRLTTGSLLAFPVGFVGALLPSAVSALGMLVVQTAVATDDLTRDKGLLLIGAVNIVLFLLQMFFWGSFIRLPEGGRLGLARGALVSLPYTVIFAFVGFTYVMLFAAFR